VPWQRSQERITWPQSDKRAPPIGFMMEARAGEEEKTRPAAGHRITEINLDMCPPWNASKGRFETLQKRPLCASVQHWRVLRAIRQVAWRLWKPNRVHNQPNNGQFTRFAKGQPSFSVVMQHGYARQERPWLIAKKPRAVGIYRSRRDANQSEGCIPVSSATAALEG
jgi:hypothetical protein